MNEDIEATNKNIETIFARMAVHEFLLENLYASVCLSQPDPQKHFDNFSRDFLKLLDKPGDYDGPFADRETLERMHEKVVEIGENFLRKTNARLGDALDKKLK